MFQVRVTLRGTDRDHVRVSPPMSEQEADQHLATIADLRATAAVITLPWANFQGTDVIAAEKITAARRPRVASF
ncbi:MAG: hypothetical protein AABM29_02775 [Actinomycetota bacterium]